MDEEVLILPPPPPGRGKQERLFRRCHSGYQSDPFGQELLVGHKLDLRLTGAEFLPIVANQFAGRHKLHLRGLGGLVARTFFP